MAVCADVEQEGMSEGRWELRWEGEGGRWLMLRRGGGRDYKGRETGRRDERGKGKTVRARFYAAGLWICNGVFFFRSGPLFLPFWGS